MKNIKLYEEFDELHEVGNSVRPVGVTFDGTNIVFAHDSTEDAETNAYYMTGSVRANVKGTNVLIDPISAGKFLSKELLNKRL